MKKLLSFGFRVLAALLVADLAAMLICFNTIFILVWTEFVLLVPLGFGMCIVPGEAAGSFATLAIGCIGIWLCWRFKTSGSWKKYNHGCLRMFRWILSIEV